MDKIEFYKNRTLSERFSASIDFLKQNWKVLYKNIFIGALPLAILSALGMQYYQKMSFGNMYSDALLIDMFFIIFYIVSAVALSIYLTAMTGAVLIRYGEGKLTSSTGWNDLNKSMFSLSGKTFVIGLMVGIVVGALVGILALLFGLSFSGIAVGNYLVVAFVVLLLCAALFALLPS